MNYLVLGLKMDYGQQEPPFEGLNYEYIHQVDCALYAPLGSY
jgi:hypothetical protein